MQTVAACGAWATPVAFRTFARRSNGTKVEPIFRFSPDGKLVDFTDMGPGPDGQDAAQVFILDVETGERTQLTHLPPAPLAGVAGTRTGDFLNDRTIVVHYVQQSRRTQSR